MCADLKIRFCCRVLQGNFFFNRADILPLIVKFCHKTLKVVKNSHAAAEAALLRVHDHILAPPPPVINGEGLASWFS